MQATYNPVFDEQGNPFKVVKFATDVTAQRKSNAEYEGKVAAIDRSQGIIEFDLNGRVLNANENFLKVWAIVWTRFRVSTIACSAKTTT